MNYVFFLYLCHVIGYLYMFNGVLVPRIFLLVRASEQVLRVCPARHDQRAAAATCAGQVAPVLPVPLGNQSRG